MAIDLLRDDTNCSKIEFAKEFDARKDIYFSFQIPKLPRLINEGEENVILTEDGEIIIFDNIHNITVFLIDARRGIDQTAQKGDCGVGSGVMALCATGRNFPHGASGPDNPNHVISVCLDFYGGYGLKDTFLSAASNNGEERGNTVLVPNSITARVSTARAPYDFLSTTPVRDFDALTTNFKNFRFAFKEHLNKIVVDVKRDDKEKFETIFEAETNFNILAANAVRIGLSFSGTTNLSIKDPTFSADISPY